MNKTKIEWCDYTWNPITGCSFDCPYCYARRIAMRFDGHFRPTLHGNRLEQPAQLKKPSKIFVCSMADMWDPAVEQLWRNLVYCALKGEHEYYFLTKQPQNITEQDRNTIYGLRNYIGVSVTKKRDRWRIKALRQNTCEGQVSNRFISFEPLLEDVGKLSLKGISWIIIGAQTNPSILPRKAWVENIVKQARKNRIPVFLKKNLKGGGRGSKKEN